MVTERARIDSLEAGLSVLAAAVPGSAPALVVTVHTSVPEWLVDLVHAARSGHGAVVVEADPAPELFGDALAGWEIGVATAALDAGARDVIGIDPARVARVREVVASLAAAAPVPMAMDAGATSVSVSESSTEREPIP